MKVLSISLDKKILNSGSENQNRQKDYAALAEDFRVVVLSTDKKDPQQISNSFCVYSSNSSFKFSYSKDAMHLARTLPRPDVVTAQDPYVSGVVAHKIAKFLKAKLHLQVHIDLFSPYFKRESWRHWIYFRIAKKLLPKADSIRAVSHRIKDGLMGMGINPDKITVLPVHTDISKFSSLIVSVDLHQKYPQFDFIIVMASRLAKQKNIGLAIEVMGKLISKYPKTGLVIVGSGPEEKKLKDMASKFKDNIIFESWSDNIASYYKTADLFLLTSNYEGYPRSVVEAMASGCPVLMSDLGLSGELIKDGENGMLFEIGNTKVLMAKLIFAIENKEKLRELARNAIQITSQQGSKEDYLKKYQLSWQNCLS